MRFLRFIFRCLKFTLKFLLKSLDLVGKYGIIILCSWALINVIYLETAYFNKYENSYVALDRQHEQQMIVSNVIQSQRAWVRTTDAMRGAYLTEKAKNTETRKALARCSYETYHILRILERNNPEVYQELMEDIRFPQEVLDLFDEFDEYFDDPTPMLEESPHGNQDTQTRVLATG